MSKPPTVSLADDVEGAAGRMSGLSVAPTTSKPRGLLDLPDELLEHVLWQLFRMLLNTQDASVAYGLRAPLDETLINKRLHALAKPIWYTAFNAYADEQPLMLARLCARTDLHKSLEDLCLEISVETSPVLPIVAIFPFNNLVHLRLDLNYWPDADDSTCQDIAHVLDLLLGKLPHLADLVIDNTDELPACNFTLTPSSSLRRLRAGFGNWLCSVVTPAAESLRRLEVRRSIYDGIALPWPTLENLDLAWCDDMEWLPSFLKVLRARPKSTPTALKALHVCFSQMDDEDEEDEEPAPDALWHELFEALQGLDLRVFGMRHLRPMAWLPDAPPLPSVTELRLQGLQALDSPGVLAALPAFLASFPSVRTIRLAHCHFARDVEKSHWPTTIAKLDEAHLALTMPHLNALLVYLRSTPILEFCYLSHISDLQLCWTRTQREEAFVRGKVWADIED